MDYEFWSKTETTDRPSGPSIRGVLAVFAFMVVFAMIAGGIAFG